MRQRTSPTLTSPIPRAWTPQERALAGLPPEVAPEDLEALCEVTLPPFAPTTSYLASIVAHHPEERLGAIFYARHDRNQLRALCRLVQRLHPRTAPADKRNNRELASYLARMLTNGRYVAEFRD